uniref:Uncharacterized protein MANES_18G106200 n=1 Tax=Rhizophora mucronata TaxID=61149 RepID=A0A2P2JNN1_RHIMU
MMPNKHYTIAAKPVRAIGLARNVEVSTAHRAAIIRRRPVHSLLFLALPRSFQSPVGLI